MAKQPQQQPLQDIIRATIKALIDRISQLESGCGRRGNGGRKNGRGRRQYRNLGSSSFPKDNDGGIRTTRKMGK